MNVVVHAYRGRARAARGRGRARQPTASPWRCATTASGIRPRPDVDRPSLRIGLSLIAALSSSFAISGGLDRGTEVVMHLPLHGGGADGRRAAERRARRRRADATEMRGRPAGAARRRCWRARRRARRPPRPHRRPRLRRGAAHRRDRRRAPRAASPTARSGSASPTATRGSSCGSARWRTAPRRSIRDEPRRAGDGRLAGGARRRGRGRGGRRRRVPVVASACSRL